MSKSKLIRDLFLERRNVHINDVITLLASHGHTTSIRLARATIANSKYYCDYRLANDRKGNYTLISTPLPDHIFRSRDDGYFVVTLYGKNKWSKRCPTRREAEEYLETVQAREAESQHQESGLCTASSH